MYKIVTEEVVTEVKKTVKDVTLAEFVGYKVRTIRLKRKLSVEELQVKLEGKVTLSHLKNIEKGLNTMRLKDMEAISTALGIDVYTLFSVEKEPPIKE